MESQWIVCIQCDMEFEYETAEQVRHAEKGYDAPQRCPACRKHKHKFMNEWQPWEPKDRKKIIRNRGERW